MKKISKKIKYLELEFKADSSVNNPADDAVNSLANNPADNSKCLKSWTKELGQNKLKKSVCGVHRSFGQKKPQAVFFDNLISIEELADYIGVSQKTIRNWVALRSIPFLRIGRKTFFRYEKLNSWLQTKEFEPCL